MVKKEPAAEIYESVSDGLKQLYRSKIKPVEEAYRFGEFYSPLLNDSDFDAKPMVLLLGQYSVGKTSFIKYLLGRDFPGAHIGPEPTTDRFIAVMHGNEDKTTPGACFPQDLPPRRRRGVCHGPTPLFSAHSPAGETTTRAGSPKRVRERSLRQKVPCLVAGRSVPGIYAAAGRVTQFAVRGMMGVTCG